MIGFAPKHLYKGCHHLASPVTTTCTTAGTFYKIGGTWLDGDCNEGFLFDGLGKLTYTGEDGAAFHITGVSELRSSRAAKITYVLYVNGVEVPCTQTEHDFLSSAKTSTIAMTAFIRLQKYDYLEVYVKSDTGSTVATHGTLQIALLGDR